MKKFRDAKYNPEGYTLFSYAAVKAWAEAVNKAKSNDAASVAIALTGGKYDSAVGVLEFDQKGDIKNPIYDIYVWPDHEVEAPASRERAWFAGPFFFAVTPP